MTLLNFLLLLGAGIVGGASNAVVGGGTFVTFPVLLALGIPPVAANIANKIGLWPASITAARAYLPELKQRREGLLLRSVIAAVGGIAGAVLLLASGEALFVTIVPWLLLVATLVFAFSSRIVKTIAKLSRREHASAATVLFLEFLCAVYGGYFGAGLGILLMAALVLGGENDAQIANGQKNFLTTFINGAAVIFFIFAGDLMWHAVIAVMIGAFIGGYFGAHAAKRIPVFWMRAVVIVVGLGLSLIYFEKQYG